MANTDDELTVYTDDVLNSTMSIDISSMSNYTYSTTGATGASGSYYVSTGAGSNGTWNTTSPYIFSTNNTGIGNITGSGLHVTSDAEFDGDVKIKGVSIAKALETINKRLAILVPDPAKLEHFEALQKAYQHYKTLEALCEIPEKKDDGS